MNQVNQVLEELNELKQYREQSWHKMNFMKSQFV
jgi:hypothetical protein